MAFFKKPNILNDKKTVREQNFDRTFILFGKGSTGKSTLGNLLLGGKPFKEHKVTEGFGLTKKVQSADCKIDAAKVYDFCEMNCEIDNKLKIQVLDQPGSNDHDFTQEQYCTFLKQCIAEAKAEMSASFLILISLNSRNFTAKELLTILNLAEILSDSAYSFFPNAIVVFTQADNVVPDMNPDELEEILQAKLKTEEYGTVKDLIEFVGGRYIFVNAGDTRASNRINILKTLFQLIRPHLNLYIHGNNAFKGNELKVLLGENEKTKSFGRKLLKYDVEYHFKFDLNLFKKSEVKEIEEKVVNALKNLSSFNNGISTIVLLINFEELFNIEMYDLIVNTPKAYNLDEAFNANFWSYACIMFRVPVDSEEFVRRNFESNKLLESLALKVNHRYAWITESISPEECSRKLTDLARKVKQDTEGKSYTDRVVLEEMSRMIDGSAKLRKGRNKEQMGAGIQNSDIRREVPVFQGGPNDRVLVNSNNFFWDKESISPQIGYYILKNLSPDLAEEFRKKYPYEGKKIPTEEYSAFCLQEMKKF